MSKEDSTSNQEAGLEGGNTNTPAEAPKRKRRLSKKEQKLLKKQRKKFKAQQNNKQNVVDKTDNETITCTPITVDGISQATEYRSSDNITTKKHKIKKKKKQNMSSKDKEHISVTKAEFSDTADDTYNYLKSYVSSVGKSEISNAESSNKFDLDANGDGLGKWFPTAKIIKASQVETSRKGDTEKQKSCTILLFYQYAIPQWSKEKVDQLISLLVKIGQARGLGGRIRVANEGVNATISCVGENLDQANKRHGCIQIRHFAEDLKRFDPIVFAQTDFKYMDYLPMDRHFKDFKILPVQELVFYGIKEQDAPLANGGVHLPPKEYHQKLGKKDCVVIDVRNHYEAAIGRFDGQMENDKKLSKKMKKSKTKNENVGAEYIDPFMRKSTDFTTWLDKDETQEKLKGKEVLMYCTGGVRCERASAYLKTKLGDKLELKGVFQLQGGIEKYLKDFPDGGYWKGKNFVFDKREAISADNPNGDGGVVRKNKKGNNIDADGGAICCCCGSPWDRYIGKKKCFTCGVPVLMCDKCMSKKPDKTPGMELSVRCPLCKKEGITVPATDVEYTDNGKKSKGKKINENDEKTSFGEKKAAASVLKWGGGHATKKKELRKLKRKMSQLSSTHKIN